MIADPCSVHGDDLRVARQLGCKENDRDEDEQAAEHIHVIRDEGEIVVQDDLAQRNLVLKEIIHLLRQVENDCNREDEHDGKKERAQKLLDNIEIETLHANLQFTMYNVQFISGT